MNSNSGFTVAWRVTDATLRLPMQEVTKITLQCHVHDSTLSATETCSHDLAPADPHNFLDYETEVTADILVQWGLDLIGNNKQQEIESTLKEKINNAVLEQVVTIGGEAM
jgi:hypothetical protein